MNNFYIINFNIKCTLEWRKVEFECKFCYIKAEFIVQLGEFFEKKIKNFSIKKKDQKLFEQKIHYSIEGEMSVIRTIKDIRKWSKTFQKYFMQKNMF